MHVATVVGARPEFVQLAPVSRALRKRHHECLIHTGQHYDFAMSEQFFQELALPEPDYHLGCGSGSHGAQTGRMLEAIEQVLLDERPDWVVVFGDTNSTLAAALAAAKLHIPLAHVEAGLRSFNREMPEEINRVVTDHISDRLFCPTETARKNVANEGIAGGVEVVGDVMYDIQLQVMPLLEERTERLLSSLRVEPGRYFLVTVHRAGNTDDPQAMRNIVSALNRLPFPVLFPVHPRTRKSLRDYDISWERHIHLIEPVGYLDMLTLERSALRILTDSGGVQKQAFFFQVPCITLREETEWVETVETGWNTLVGSQPEAILQAIHLPLPDPVRDNPFGRGDAAERIVQAL
ncbi:MAG TPA: UDP-N-acetylglucosamine 2-epimerase (non-hydrolyzing) [Ktedonobacteraceae bacterium]|jgi:UDP-N-acetylglucosamine 2-epimerase|nr:UDP-N-acetylglucosamine 2-epimerase (non-hydrolyzing) [Ktedonobacteraceae bacterium]